MGWDICLHVNVFFKLGFHGLVNIAVPFGASGFPKSCGTKISLRITGGPCKKEGSKDVFCAGAVWDLQTTIFTYEVAPLPVITPVTHLKSHV